MLFDKNDGASRPLGWRRNHFYQNLLSKPCLSYAL
jgi:hypothetical protein